MLASTPSVARLVALTALALVLGPAPAAAQEADVIRLSVYQPAALPCGPQMIAEAKGYFEEERIKFKPIFVQNGPQVVQHMAAGEMDIGCAAITVWMIGKSKGVDLVVLQSTAKGNAPLVVKPSITDIKQLDGKRCGTPGLGTSPKSYTPKHLAERILTSKAALEGERKQVTVLFADLKASMEVLADRDPEKARKIVDPVVHRTRGRRRLGARQVHGGRGGRGDNLRNAIMLPILLVAVFVGAAGASPSTTRVQVPTQSASPASLPGELTMPRGAGPFPAVILLHGCVGIVPASRERLLEYASWYADRGYAGLILDSFASRGVSTLCLGGEPGPLTRAFDAYRALEYLAGLGSIDSRRVVLQGHSHGGASVLTALDELTAEMAGTPLRFAAGVAYYPPCAYGSAMSAEFYAPVLILIGEKDDWTPAPACEQLHARQGAQAPGRVRLTVYPGATHSFDFDAPPRWNEYGHYLAYDPDATSDAARRVEGFLREVVK